MPGAQEASEGQNTRARARAVKMEVNAVDDVERKKREVEEGGGGEEEDDEEEEVDATGVTSMLLLSCA